MKRTFENDLPIYMGKNYIFFKSTFLQWIEIISEVYSYLFDASLFKSVFLLDFKWDFSLLTFCFSKECIFSLSFVKSINFVLPTNITIDLILAFNKFFPPHFKGYRLLTITVVTFMPLPNIFMKHSCNDYTY